MTLRRIALVAALLGCTPPAVPPEPEMVDVPTLRARCLVIVVELDVEHGTEDDAGVWHYPSRDRSRWEPCP